MSNLAIQSTITSTGNVKTTNGITVVDEVTRFRDGTISIRTSSYVNRTELDNGNPIHTEVYAIELTHPDYYLFNQDNERVNNILTLAYNWLAVQDSESTEITL